MKQLRCYQWSFWEVRAGKITPVSQMDQLGCGLYNGLWKRVVVGQDVAAGKLN